MSLLPAILDGFVTTSHVKFKVDVFDAAHTIVYAEAAIGLCHFRQQPRMIITLATSIAAAWVKRSDTKADNT